MMNDYKIKNILESLKEEVENGKVSLREAAVELHKAGWTNFIDIDATRNLLKTRNVTGNGNVPGVSDMMGNYREMKAAHPDALYIFRNGESCELYEDDAIAASGILGIATAERVDGQGKGVKELRFSFRDLDVYLPKLIRAGNRVAVCEPNQTWMSQTPVEQEHIINAFSFELGKVTRPYIRERVVDLLTRIDPDLASGVARNLGIQLTREQLSRELPRPVCGLEQDPSLSLYAHTDGNLKGLRVSLLAADGVRLKSVKEICDALHEEGIHPQIIAPHMGSITTEEGEELFVDGTLSGTPSVLFDSVIVPEGEQSLTTLLKDGDAKYHLRQAYRHLKAIGLPGNAKAMLEAASLPQDTDDAGLLMPKDTKSLMPPFITAMKQHRVWSREPKTLDFGA